MKLKHRITGTILAICFATTTALPAAGIPQLKSPPKAVSAPRVPAAVAPRIPVVPKVNVPSIPKVPVVKVPTVKVPVTPRIVSAPKIPVVKAAPKIPATPRIVSAPKVPVVKAPAAPKIPTIKTPVVKVPVVAAPAKVLDTSKLAASSTASKIPASSSAVSSKSSDNQTSKRAVDSSSAGARQKKGEKKADAKTEADKKRVVVVMGYKAKHDAEKGNQNDGSQSSASASTAAKPQKKEKDFTGIEDAYRRMQESEAADASGDDSKDPYAKNGFIDRDLLNKDERLIADFENDQTGAQALLDDAKKPKDPKAPATPDEDEDDDRVPVSVTRGRIKDVAKVEGTGQLTGLNGDEKELVDAKDAIARGVVRDPKDVDRLVDKVANKGVDKQFGEAPDVDVDGLTRIGDALKKRGKFKEARDYYEQAIDALKNGGKNSAGYRLNVIADVGHGFRPARDLDRVVKPGGAATKAPVTASPGTGNGPATSPAPVTAPAPQDSAPAASPVGQRIADGVGSKGKDKAASTPAAAPAGTGAAAVGTDVAAGQPASTGVQDTAAEQGASAGVSNQLGTDTQNVGANSPQNAAAETPSSNNEVAGNNEAATGNPNASVSSPEGEIVLGSPGNDTDFVHTQSADGNTGADISYNSDGTFTATITTVTRDANGSITSSETTTMTGTWSEGTDGQKHHNPTSETTTTSDGSAPANGQGGQGSSDSDSDSDDDDNDSTTDSTTTETTDTTTETEADETTEANDDTAEASDEGTPNPEARERGGRSGRVAEQTQGRVGGEEQRNQKKGLDQRKNGNGAGGPNPEDNSSSGVLLTVQEQKAFAKNLGMKSGGGVTTPSEKDRSFAVTERDMKDIAARRGSTINPAGGGEGNGGSGLAFGKKGFAPVTGGAPAPAPKGAQSSDIDGGEGGEEGGAPRTGSGTGGATGSIFGGTSGPGVSPVRAGAAAASSVRGANVRVNAAQVNNVQR